MKLQIFVTHTISQTEIPRC